MNKTTREQSIEKQLIRGSEDRRVDGKAYSLSREPVGEDLADRVSALQKMFNEKTVPAETSTFAIRVRGPVTDSTRRHRKLLLMLSMVGILMMKTGLVPEKVTALGLVFSETDKSTILLITASCIAYFLVGFAISVICDLLVWLHAMEASEWVMFPTMRKLFRPAALSTKLMTLLRFAYEIALPLLLGCYAIRLLWDTSKQALAHLF